MRPLWFYILLLCFLSPFLARAGSGDTLERVALTPETVPWILNERWQYLPGDDPRRADPAFPDSGWTVQPHLLAEDRAEKIFPGIGWWRRTVSFDSRLASRTLALMMSQKGASEVFVNGKLMARFGRIGPDGRPAGRYSAGRKPIFIRLPAAGTYLFAVRYAGLPGEQSPGFQLYINTEAQVSENDRTKIMIVTALSMFLIGLFFAFALVHAVLFRYYRAVRSNIWFAAFSFSLALLLTVLFSIILDIRWLNAFLRPTLPFIVILAAFMLSGFINNVFSRNRIWIRVLLLAATPFVFISYTFGIIILISAIIAVSFETLFTILFALYRKQPGSRLIGSGLLLFSVLMLYLFGNVILYGDDFSLVGMEGIITGSILFGATMSIPVSMSVYLAVSFASMNRSMQAHLAEVERLSEVAREQEAEKQRLLEGRKEELEREVASRTEELRGQKQKSDDLLLNILPSEVAEELKEKGRSEARMYSEVSVLFTDFVDFTQMSEHLSPAALVAEIDHCFGTFDGIITRHGLEKIKTVGDAYIAVSGMPAANPRHAQDVVRAGLEIRAFMDARLRELPQSFGIRLGVHSGPVVAGIVGVKKFAYDIWGDTVNTAARMEQHSEPGQLNISEATYALVKDEFSCTYRGELEVKHKGRMHMYFVGEGVSSQ